MPNTWPVNDSREVCEFIRARGRGGEGRAAPSRSRAITTGQKGEEMTAFGELVEAGAVAFSDDGHWLGGGLLRHAFEHAGLFSRAIVQHCEDPTLSNHAPMHEGAVSTRLGLAGQPAMAEAVAVARDLLVAEHDAGAAPRRPPLDGALSGARAARQGRRDRGDLRGHASPSDS